MVANAVGWELLQVGILFHIHCLDDFLFSIPPSPESEHVALSYILSVFSNIGVPVALNRTEGPATTVIFLGIVLDIARLEL